MRRRIAGSMALPLLLAVAVALGLGACSPAAPSPPDLVLIVVDTLRADRLACYGDRKGLMPFVDSLADRSVVFEHAYAQAPWTIPSVASLMTSRYQAQTGMVGFDSVLSPDEVTLAEVLERHGYATGGFSANGFLEADLGWAQGFGVYAATYGRKPEGKWDLSHPVRAAELNRQALTWLDGLPERERSPYFLYLQYMEPHIPYEPPEDILDRVFDGKPPKSLVEYSAASLFRSVRKFDHATLQTIEKLYDAEVMSVDRGIRGLFEELGRRHLLERAVVVITADHGNEYYDHGQIGHGHSLYDELIHVPLLVRMPGQTRRVDVAEPVALVDVAASLLERAGIAVPDRYEGQSFASVLDRARPGWRGWLHRMLGGSETRRGSIESELIRPPTREPRLTPHVRATILGAEKLISGVEGQQEFYDLVADPGEEHPDALDAASRQRLERALEEYLTHVASRPAPALRRRTSPEVRERLRALGYLD